MLQSETPFDSNISHLHGLYTAASPSTHITLSDLHNNLQNLTGELQEEAGVAAGMIFCKGS